jgi:L-lactate dehydrogenase complex protein LldG
MSQSHHSREIILEKIRENLARGSSEEPVGASIHKDRFARRAEEKGLTLLGIFERELTLLGGKVKRVASEEALYSSLRNTFREEGYKRAVLSREPLLEALKCKTNLEAFLEQSEVEEIDSHRVVEQLRHADVGVTACEFLAAETGTVVLRSSGLAPRLLSLLPRCHIVIAREEQLVPTVAACLTELQTEKGFTTQSSCLTLVTGSSRTADIEKVLVKGVHGPRDLHVFIMVK